MPLSTARLPFETTFTYPPEKCKDTKGAMKWSDAEVPEGAYSRFGKGSVGKFSIPFGEGVQDPASLLGSGRLGIMDSTVERLWQEDLSPSQDMEAKLKNRIAMRVNRWGLWRSLAD